jgi:hypothetical protein
MQTSGWLRQQAGQAASARSARATSFTQIADAFLRIKRVSIHAASTMDAGKPLGATVRGRGTFFALERFAVACSADLQVRLSGQASRSVKEKIA